jgi:nitrite reductase (NO-forming)
LLALLTLLILSGCQGGAAAVSGPPVTDARVGLVEWQVATSAGALKAGPVTLQVTNAGTTEHDLRVRGVHVDGHTARLSPGQKTVLSLDLTGERRVELWCTVPGHRAEGMHTTLRVGV